MAISSQGTSLKFSGTLYTVTSISVNFGAGNNGGAGGTDAGPGQQAGQKRQRVSAAYLDSDPELAEPYFEIWQPDPDGEGKLTADGSTTATVTQSQVQIEFIGTTAPVYKAVGELEISGAVNLVFNSAKCESSSIRLAVGDVVRGNASFTVS